MGGCFKLLHDCWIICWFHETIMGSPEKKIWSPKGTRDCVGFRVSYFYWTHWRVAGLLQCSLHSIRRGKPSVRLESSVSPSHVEMTEKKCECGTWGVSWTGGTSNHPILDHVSIETHGFRDPPLKKYNFIQSQHRFFLTITSVVFTELHLQYICQYMW